LHNLKQYENKKILKQFASSHQKLVVIYRDPKDVIVSAARWNSDYSWESITLTIKKIFNKELPYNILYDVKRFSGFLSLCQSKKNVRTVRFEDIIGNRGNGSDHIQRKTVRKLALFLGYKLSEEEISRVIEKSWGKGHTFRCPEIGGWEKYLVDEYYNLFKNSKWNELTKELGYKPLD